MVSDLSGKSDRSDRKRASFGTEKGFYVPSPKERGGRTTRLNELSLLWSDLRGLLKTTEELTSLSLKFYSDAIS